LIIDKKFWDIRWELNETGWDIGYVSTPLKNYFDKIKDKSISILIPGCGNSYEAEYLLNNGFNNISVIDISSVLIEEVRKKYSSEIQKGSLKVFEEDFFNHKGHYDLIIEQTFFCAIYPTLRIKYADKMNELLLEKGRVIGLLFDFKFDSGPPFGGSKEEYLNYFLPYFEILKMEKCYNSIPQRAGNELFFIIESNRKKAVNIYINSLFSF